MTPLELRYMSVVPKELRGIREQLEELNEKLAVIAQALNNAANKTD